MNNEIKEQVLNNLEKIQQMARRLSETQDPGEAKTLCDAIDQEVFQARTLVNDLSFVAPRPCVKKEEEQETASVAPQIVHPEDVSGKKKYVLIAEDVDCNYMIASLVLRDHYRVERAKNGLEAVEMVEKERPDIVLMDIKMPVMDGYGACGILKTKYPTLPIIAVTAYLQMEEQRRIIKSGFDDFLQKPLNLGVFTKLVAEKLKA